jgi:hypothetical protein
MQVKKFFIRAALFILLNLFVLAISLLVIRAFENRYQYHNWETDSDLLIIPKNKTIDLLIMGSSHARIFTRDKNHLRVEKILDKSMIDIGKGGGEGGIVTNLVMLKYFYAQGNTAKEIVYFIDAWPFFSKKWNENSYFLTNEPINGDLLQLCLRYHVSKDVMINYFKSKYTIDWLQRAPKTGESNDNVLQDVSPEAIHKRLESLYIEPYNAELFSHYALLLEDAVKTAQEHHSRLKFVFPTTLLDDTRGKDKVIALMREFQEKYGTPFYDFSDAIKDYHYYYDHDHLNTKGVELFTKEYLKKICD